MPNIEELITSSWFNIFFSVIIFILGNVVAYVLYRRQLQPMRLFWDEKTVSVFSPVADSLPELKTTYMKKRVRRLYVSRVVFWNAGLKSITLSDASTANPLRVLVGGENSEIISMAILKTNNDSNMISLGGYYSTALAINFDYLKQYDGAIVEIVHTGYEPKIAGELKDGFIQHKSTNKAELLDAFPFNLLWFRIKEPLRRRIKLAFVSFAALLLGTTIPLLFHPLPVDEPTLALYTKVRLVIGLVIYVWLFFELWSSPGLPKGLYEFYDKME